MGFLIHRLMLGLLIGGEVTGITEGETPNAHGLWVKN